MRNFVAIRAEVNEYFPRAKEKAVTSDKFADGDAIVVCHVVQVYEKKGKADA